MTPIVIIPARLASTRLRHKPLADIHGKPMIQHVWERAMAADIGPVVVAAGDTEIYDVITGLGGRCILTDPSLPKGSDRVWTAVRQADPDIRHDVVIDMQGDQPTTEPRLLAQLLRPLAADPAVDVATLVVPFSGPEVEDRNIVKAVVSGGPGLDGIGRCLYFSRAAVPFGGPFFHHLGLYAYRRATLGRYAVLPRGRLELSEDLEQLRLLEAGYRYDAVVVMSAPLSVDTPEDLEAARRVLAVG